MPDWTYTASGGGSLTYTLDNNGSTYVLDTDTDIVSLDSDGNVRWTNSDVAGDGTTIQTYSVTNDGSEVYVNFYKEKTVVLDGTDGSQLNSYNESFGLASRSKLIPKDNTSREVYAIQFSPGDLIDYDIENNSIIKSLSSPNGEFRDLQLERDFTDGTHIFLTDDAGYLYKINLSDFSIDYSVDVTSNPLTIESVGGNDSVVHVSEYDYDTNEATYWTYDFSGSSFSLVRTETRSSSYDYEHHNGDSAIYGPDSNGDLAGFKYDNGTAINEYTGAFRSSIGVEESYNTDKFFVEVTQGELAQLDRSEFTTLLASASATQFDSTASINSTTTTRISPVSASQIAVSGLMVSGVADTIPRFEATQTAVSAPQNNPSLRAFTTPAKFVTNDGTSFKFNGFKDEGQTLRFRRGEAQTRTIMFNNDEVMDHTEEYNRFVTNFNKYLTGEAVKLVQTYDGKTHFKQNVNTLAEVDSFLVKYVPQSDSSKDVWWFVLIDMTDATRLIGTAEEIKIEFVPLTPVSEGDRTYIKDNFEV